MLFIDYIDYCRCVSIVMLGWLLAFSSAINSFQQPIFPSWALIGGCANKQNWGLLPGKISCPVLPLRLHTDLSYLLMKVAGFTAWRHRCKGCPGSNHFLIHNLSLAHRNVIGLRTMQVLQTPQLVHMSKYSNDITRIVFFLRFFKAWIRDFFLKICTPTF